VLPTCEHFNRFPVGVAGQIEKEFGPLGCYTVQRC